MTSVWDRQDPRVCYQVPVGVLDPEQQKLLNMVSINLSRGGMFVDTPEELPIGKELVCNVPIGDTLALQLRGRVAWQRPRCIGDERRPRGVGIEFIDLSPEDREHLVQIVGEREELSHPVRLQVEGMQGAINAHAQLTPQGIFFRSPLPFLRLNSQVDFAFDDDNSRESYQGRIVDVKVHRETESAVPHLQVEVELLTIGHDENEIPCGIGSDAVYEVMHIDRDDTIPNPVDVALDDAIDEVIDSEMCSVDRGEPEFVRGRSRGPVGPRPEAIEPFREQARPDEIASAISSEVAMAVREEFDEDDALQDDEIDDDELRGGHERATESDPILLVMPKKLPAISSDALDLNIEDEAEHRALHAIDRRLWIGAGAMLVLLLVAVWIGGSDGGKATPRQDNGEGSLLAQAASAQAQEAERVRAIIEGPGPAVPVHVSEDEPAEETPVGPAEDSAPSRALATGGPKARAASAPAPATKSAPTSTSPAKAAPAPSARPATGSKRQRLGGVHMREDQDRLVIRVPIQGSTERASEYMLADPAGFAVNLPYAQPSEGYHDSLAPESDTVRLLWVRERLGGLHLRIFFAGSAPACKTEFAKSQVTVSCTR